MDPITREQARRDIVELGLPQFILDAFDEKPLPHNLDLTFGSPHHVLDGCADQQPFYGTGRITPIYINDVYITAYHHGPLHRGFFRFDIETPETANALERFNWQQILVEDIYQLSGGINDEDELREIADLVGFREIESFLRELNALVQRNVPYKEYETYVQLFVARLADTN